VRANRGRARAACVLHGAVTPEGAKRFPNAVLRIARLDVEDRASPSREAAAPENQSGRFVGARRAVAACGVRLQPLAPGAELSPGIRSLATAARAWRRVTGGVGAAPGRTRLSARP
jgi:hypothetical protein